MATDPNLSRDITPEERKVIFASSLGTVFEWYDFYLYGTLAVFFAPVFFPKGNDTANLLASLATFGAGFAVRPFGALVFGRLGDMIGRKYTFLVTIVLMGLSTAAVGVIPTYDTIGVAAPILLVTLRLIQGLALGGEYGGAATYVAEHAPNNKRGAYTSWIQTTATLGFFLSLLVIFLFREIFDAKQFAEFGWRAPFLLSVILLIVSIYIRLQLAESPVFQRMKAEGKHSTAPLTESFTKWGNLKIVLLALFGATAGQGVVWYTGQFYALYFLTTTLKVDYKTAYLLVAASLLLGTPFFVIFGKMSDKIGRKWIMMGGCLIAAVTYIPLFHGLTHYANPALEAAQQATPVTVAVATGQTCEFKTFPDAKGQTNDCAKIKDFLAKSGVPYANTLSDDSAPLLVTVGTKQVTVFKDEKGFTTKNVVAALKEAGYPLKADANQVNHLMVIVILTIMMLYVTMVYGPIAAFLVELFPTRIRYTSMSLPYHIGNGWFGGFLPFVASAMVVAKGDIYYGLWYPIGFAVMTLVIGTLFIRETNHKDIDAE
jgi:MFS family permease